MHRRKQGQVLKMLRSPAVQKRIRAVLPAVEADRRRVAVAMIVCQVQVVVDHLLHPGGIVPVHQIPAVLHRIRVLA